MNEAMLILGVFFLAWGAFVAGALVTRHQTTRSFQMGYAGGMQDHHFAYCIHTEDGEPRYNHILYRPDLLPQAIWDAALQDQREVLRDYKP